ncbi:MAG: YciI family protein [Paludibacter sp.]
MYLIILTYTQGLEKIDEHLVEHRTFLDKYCSRDKFICSGAQNPRTGGIILCNADSKAEVESIIREDPFHIYDAASYEIIEFSPTKYANAFKVFIK